MAFQRRSPPKSERDGAARGREEEAFVLGRGDEGRGEGHAPERSRIPLQGVGEGGAEKQEAEREGHLGQARRERRVQRLEAGQDRRGPGGRDPRRAVPAEPAEEGEERGDLKERKQKGHRVVVPPSR